MVITFSEPSFKTRAILCFYMKALNINELSLLNCMKYIYNIEIKFIMKKRNESNMTGRMVISILKGVRLNYGAGLAKK